MEVNYIRKIKEADRVCREPQNRKVSGTRTGTVKAGLQLISCCRLSVDMSET